jgi:quercetin dioxygenase-like cupin family protein
MQLYDWEKLNPEQVTELYTRKVALGENISVAKLEVKKGAATRMHSHDNEEIIFLLKGVWQFYLPSGEVTLKANQMLTIPPGTEHGSRVLEDVVAVDICSPARVDWLSGEDHILHHDPDESLWAV